MVTFIAVVVGFLAIFQSMYTAVLERTREIGILKSMGASKTDIVSVVLRETAVMAAAGVVLGIAGTFGVKLMMAHVFPLQQFDVTGHVDCAGCGHRVSGGDDRGALSSLDGGAQRSDRRVGL